MAEFEKRLYSKVSELPAGKIYLLELPFSAAVLLQHLETCNLSWRSGQSTKMPSPATGSYLADIWSLERVLLQPLEIGNFSW